MAFVFLGLGSNQGNRMVYLLGALENISRDIGVIQSHSSVYQSEAWGYDSENDFLNMVVFVSTNLLPDELILVCKSIEAKAGRVKDDAPQGYQDRTLDIDILFYDALVLSTEKLTIPHPKMAERKFVLTPLVEIAPDWEHPVQKKSCGELLRVCLDTTKISIITSL